VRENRKHGLMREGRVKPALYSTYFIPGKCPYFIPKNLDCNVIYDTIQT
jgi:hypothetical protein